MPIISPAGKDLHQFVEVRTALPTESDPREEDISGKKAQGAECAEGMIEADARTLRCSPEL